MAKRKKYDTEEVLWDLLVAIPALLGFLYGYNPTHSLVITGLWIAGSSVPGIIILIVRKVIIDNRLKRSGIDEIDKMDGLKFEEYLKQLFKSQGYHVIKTPASGDFGADLVIEKEHRKIVVQAKRYKKNVGIKAVQEVYGSKAHYKADEAWVITNSNYTSASKKLARENEVKLLNREQLIDLILKSNPKTDASNKTHRMK